MSASRKNSVLLPLANRKIGGRYRIVRRIGAGSFGEIYEALDILTNTAVAMKLEKVSIAHPQLIGESKYYSYLTQGRGAALMPAYYFYGTEEDYSVMVMELLGSSLEDLFNYCGKKLSLKTTLMLGEQMVGLLEYAHSKSVLHRDIKPDNFIMGASHANRHKVFIIDFGLAKRFRDPRTRKHIPYKEGKSLTGTARYCSINTHLGIEQSRRDDLEGIGYILLYFLRGSLPWQGLKTDTNSDKYVAIARCKMSTPVGELCQGLPVEFATYVNYTRCLRFDEKPDYGYLRNLFRSVFRARGYQPDRVYDWTVRQLHEQLAEQRSQRAVATRTGSSGAVGKRSMAEEENTIAVV